MSYSKANILTLVGTLALSLQDSTSSTNFFDVVVERWAEMEMPAFFAQALVELSDGTATYSFAAACLALFHAIMEDASITEAHDEDLDSYSTTWRTDEGTPFAFTQDFLARQYTLYPTPNFNSTALAGGATQPLGEDYPEDNLWLIYCERRESAIQDYYAIPLALSIMALEFSHSSDHQDLELSLACSQLAALFLALLGH